MNLKSQLFSVVIRIRWSIFDEIKFEHKFIKECNPNFDPTQNSNDVC